MRTSAGAARALAPRPDAWQRNVFAVTAASFMGYTGFTLVMPFLPLYFHQLGAKFTSGDDTSSSDTADETETEEHDE